MPLVGRQVEPVDDFDRGARVHRAFFRIERRVGGEQDALRPEKAQAALGRLPGAEQRGIGIEKPKIIDRPLL